eukprot:936643-Pleurochrysis_carterae.AAC.1
MRESLAAVGMCGPRARSRARVRTCGRWARRLPPRACCVSGGQVGHRRPRRRIENGAKPRKSSMEERR